MKIKVSQINQLLVVLVYSLTFFGFYLVLLILLDSGMGVSTRDTTIPLRIVIGGSLITLALLNITNLYVDSRLRWFSLFAGAYLLRIFFDSIAYKSFHLSYEDLLLYFFSFCVVPFVFITMFKLTDKNLKGIIHSMIYTGFLFSLAAVALYGQFVGQVTRLRSSAAGEDVISPLALSYCSTLVIGVSIAYLIYNKVSLQIKLVSILTIVLSLIPFFLGASRGSLFALFVPFIVLVLARSSFSFTIKMLILSISMGAILVLIDENIGSGLLNRFLSTADAIDQGGSSAIRLQIWNNSFNQFLDNPVFGDKLQVNNWNGYPHNILVELLQSVGFIGFFPFLVLLISAFKVCLRIFRSNLQYAWVAFLFLQTFSQNMFSGAIYSAAWFWTSIGLLFATDVLLKQKTQNIIG